ncbi:MAG: hypothetical protein ACI841_003212 [Planctomycetota bacterium]|jgi:hypothetical protein
MNKGIIALLALLVVITILGFTLPTEFDIERKVQINAPKEKIHALVGELKQWDEFMPWKDDDPTMEVTFGDKTTGVGAMQKWTGKDGDGELTFTRCDPATGIAYKMFFINGEERMPSTASMNYTEKNGGVEVSWVMSGNLDMAFGGGFIKMLMTSSINDMFDTGLGRLKEKAEANG